MPLLSQSRSRGFAPLCLSAALAACLPSSWGSESRGGEEGCSRSDRWQWVSIEGDSPDCEVSGLELHLAELLGPLKHLNLLSLNVYEYGLSADQDELPAYAATVNVAHASDVPHSARKWVALFCDRARRGSWTCNTTIEQSATYFRGDVVLTDGVSEVEAQRLLTAWESTSPYELAKATGSLNRLTQSRLELAASMGVSPTDSRVEAELRKQYDEEGKPPRYQRVTRVRKDNRIYALDFGQWQCPQSLGVRFSTCERAVCPLSLGLLSPGIISCD